MRQGLLFNFYISFKVKITAFVRKMFGKYFVILFVLLKGALYALQFRSEWTKRDNVLYTDLSILCKYTKLVIYTLLHVYMSVYISIFLQIYIFFSNVKQTMIKIKFNK